ncbi:phosphopantetheine-binding protein, partial [Kitasatospora sp. NPDC005856]|uniref:phosphopantetheine-binding protein n=1 Tax=Kitasatospora sp. NPDC005856 TaxID=3154566 RepID=UPI0034071266
HRHTQGLPATSLAWGLWNDTSTLTNTLTTTDHQRLTTNGLTPLTTPTALTLFDTTLTTPHPHLLLTGTDRTTLRKRARNGTLPPLFERLVPTPVRQSAASGGPSLAERLSGLDGNKRAQVLLDLVRTHVAAVLGHESAGGIDPDSALKELGFDSLTAVSLRNQLSAATGLRLPTTLVFDHPSTAAIASFLGGQFDGGAGRQAPVQAELERLESAVAATDLDEAGRERLGARLQALLLRVTGTRGTAAAAAEDDDLASVTDSELFDVLDQELGLSGLEDR